jgi:hypothetical protein
MSSFRAIVAAAGVALALHATPADACSVCLAGDPIFSAQGTSSQAAGSFSAYLELRGYSKESGRDVAAPVETAVPAHTRQASTRRWMGHGGHVHLPPGFPDPNVQAEAGAESASEDEHGSTKEEHDALRLDLHLAWTPIDRLTLTLGVPWVANDVSEVEHGESTHLSLAGLGDVSLAASGVVWRNREVMPSTWVELRAFGKAPTGADEQHVDGVLDAHVQAGTGSWDYGFGTAVVHRFAWGSLYASGFYRRNGEGGLEYRYGDVALGTLAVDVPLGHLLGRRALDRLTPGFGFDFRWADRDEQDDDRVDDTGGAILYATPSLRVALPSFSETQRAWLRSGVQIPLTNEWLYGTQDEGPVWSVGIGYGF